MAMTSAKVGETVIGNFRVTYGTWTAGGDTGGNINTGLRLCNIMLLTASGGSIVADAPTVNETLPYNGAAITIITTSNTSGYWMAFGD